MADESLLDDTKLFSRFAVALGGFLIFVGIVIFGLFILNFLDFIEFNILETESFQKLLLGIFLVIGLIDLIAAVILWKR